MAWTEITRRKYRRDGLRYASHLMDAEWALIEPLLPPASPLGRPRETNLRSVMNAILYMASTGCQCGSCRRSFHLTRPCRAISTRGRARACSRTSITPWSWRRARQIGREASPTAGVIDSQSAKTTESGGPRGFDAGKKIKGRKRHIVTDTQGNVVGLVVHEADIQDRDGAPRVLASIRALYPWLRHVFADGGYAGDKLRAALKGKDRGRCKSSSVRMPQKASKSYRAAGSSKGPSLGSVAAAASPRTSRPQSPARSHGSSLHMSALSRDASQGLDSKQDHFESDS